MKDLFPAGSGAVLNTETFSPEFIRCYACKSVWFGLFPMDLMHPDRPLCPKCHSKEVFIVADSTEFEQRRNN